MHQFFERHSPQKGTQGEIDHLNRPISIKEIESIINNLPKEKAPDSDTFMVSSKNHLRKKSYLFATIYYRKYKQREYLLTHSIRLILP